MVAEVARRKALAAVLEKAKVVDADGNEVDLNALNVEVEGEDGHEGHDHEGHDHAGHDHEGHDHA
jgi:trigger factor